MSNQQKAAWFAVGIFAATAVLYLVLLPLIVSSLLPPLSVSPTPLSTTPRIDRGPPPYSPAALTNRFTIVATGSTLSTPATLRPAR